MILLVLLVEDGIEGEGNLSIHGIVPSRQNRANEGVILSFQILFIIQELIMFGVFLALPGVQFLVLFQEDGKERVLVGLLEVLLNDGLALV